jgi:hypothetical protein
MVAGNAAEGSSDTEEIEEGLRHERLVAALVLGALERET